MKLRKSLGTYVSKLSDLNKSMIKVIKFMEKVGKLNKSLTSISTAIDVINKKVNQLRDEVILYVENKTLEIKIREYENPTKKTKEIMTVADLLKNILKNMSKLE